MSTKIDATQEGVVGFVDESGDADLETEKGNLEET